MAIKSGAGTPKWRPTPISAATVAAWLYNRIDSANNANANNHGYCRTYAEIAPRICSLCPSKKVEPSHAIPRIEMMATTPARMMEADTTISGLTFETNNISAVALKVTMEIELT